MYLEGYQVYSITWFPRITAKHSSGVYIKTTITLLKKVYKQKNILSKKLQAPWYEKINVITVNLHENANNKKYIYSLKKEKKNI